ncbi:MAG: ABC transporter permease, partial [Bacteroidales bacterium]|nr:ABC transporter permease [Bacteroidales bacterium]
MKIFIIKEFLQIFRDKRSMIILFGIPIVQVLLFGFALKTDMENVEIAILDQSKDIYSQELSVKLVSSGYFILNSNLNSVDEIEQVFKKGKVREVVVFEPNFGENLLKSGVANVKIITDASDPNVANIVYSYTQGIINDFLLDINKSVEKPAMIIPQTQMVYNQELKSVFMFVPGVITVILMLVSSMMTSISITREKELGTMEVLLVSPVK